MKLSVAIVLGAVVVSTAALAQEKKIYRHVDEDGTVVFTDEVTNPDAREVRQEDLPPLSVYDAPEIPEPTPVEDESDQQATAPDYGSLAISSPQPEEHFWGTGNTFTAQASLSTQLEPGHGIRFVLDGQPTEASASNSRFFDNVYRGEHSVRAEVVDSGGRVLASTEDVVFYMHQQSIQNPNNPANRGSN